MEIVLAFVSILFMLGFVSAMLTGTDYVERKLDEDV